MADYRKMYGILCRAASEALDALPDTPGNQSGRELLQEALFKAEEVYINTSADASERQHVSTMKTDL